MNIIYLTTEDVGAATLSGKVHFWALARELKQLGHTVTIVAPRYTSEEPAASEAFQIVRFLAPAKSGLGMLLFEATLLWHVRWLVRKVRPDVILVRGGGPGWFPGLVFLAFRGLGVPVVLECNGIVWREVRLRKKPWWLAANVGWSAWQQAMTCNRIIGVTREIAEIHGRLGWKRSDRLHVIPNGTDPDDFDFSGKEREHARRELGIPREAFVAGYVGTFSPWHNIPNLVEAAALLEQRPSNPVRMILIGQGELFPWTREQKSARSLNALLLPGTIHDRTLLRRWLACFDVGLCVNIPLHGSPLKLFEYLAAGIPVIGSGFPQVLQLCREDGIGIGLESSDPRSLADAIEQMASDRGQWQEVGRRNRQLAIDRFTWRRVAQDVEAVLRKAMGRRG